MIAAPRAVVVTRMASLATLLILLAGPGCESRPVTAPYPPEGAPVELVDYGIPDFRDDAKANATVDSDKFPTEFQGLPGVSVDLHDLRGKKNVVVVITRGVTKTICPICTTQTSRLIENYGKFVERDAEVVVVFPGGTQRFSEFLAKVKDEAKNAPAAATPPFPVVFDQELKVVERLGLKANLAKPATYVLDREGKVRFAYVGTHTGDRPSVKAMLDQLDLLQIEAGKPPVGGAAKPADTAAAKSEPAAPSSATGPASSSAPAPSGAP